MWLLSNIKYSSVSIVFQLKMSCTYCMFSRNLSQLIRSLWNAYIIINGMDYYKESLVSTGCKVGIYSYIFKTRRFRNVKLLSSARLHPRCNLALCA